MVKIILQNIRQQVSPKYFTFLIIFSFLASCKKDDEGNPNADFTKYISVGNSLTAGVSNSGLYNESIKYSYPNLIAQQMKLVGGGSFPLALFAAAQENGTGYLKFKGYNGFIPNIVQEINSTAIVSVQPPKLSKFVGNNQNLGIPSMKMADLDDKNISQSNIFFNRLVADNAQPISYLQLVEASNPTFFTCWLGSNDVLSFATSGGINQITDKAVFTSNLKKMLDLLTKNGAKGAIANIGDVVTIPAITILSSFRPLFATTKFYIQTKNGVREGTLKDYLLIPTNLSSLDINGIAAKGTKISEPWADNEVLDSEEVAIVQKATNEFNQILATEAQNRNLALVDAYSFLNKVKAGLTENGETVDTSFISGGVFSLDGAHLTAKGNAFTANEYIRSINAYYKTSIPLLDTKLYKGVVIE